MMKRLLLVKLITVQAQAILQNVSLAELKSNFIKQTGMDGVDILPASIEDAFIASDWF
ncbi:hypothetical protein [Photobacterium kishitanii]|uniref:hypothetical protein n=1 Tax=Photobacterium kishitanii TaxID=318456 RepID=UPI00273857B6|nr:hypothetical protein [Photobacterium kishitanii]